MLVLDANTLIRAVLGRRVRELLERYAVRGVRFLAPEAAFEEASKYLPIGAYRGAPLPRRHHGRGRGLRSGVRGLLPHLRWDDLSVLHQGLRSRGRSNRRESGPMVLGHPICARRPDDRRGAARDLYLA